MEREQVLKVMVPVGAFGLLLVIVGVVVALNSGGGTPASSASNAPNTPSAPTNPEMPNPPPASGKFDFPLDGPEWKEIGNRGLKIWDVKEGTGKVCPTLAERPGVVPIMHYTGWLTSGSTFDSSRPKGRPLDYPLSNLIEGWKEGVPGMKVGGIRRLLIPSDLGYGPQNKPGIPANSTLVFEMELVDVR